MKRKLCSWGYSLGVLASYRMSLSDGEWTVTHVRFAGRKHKPVYVLGVMCTSWRCLFKYHHIPSPHKVGLGMCAKCCPCPDCGEAAPLEHECEVAA